MRRLCNLQYRLRRRASTEPTDKQRGDERGGASCGQDLLFSHLVQPRGQSVPLAIAIGLGNASARHCQALAAKHCFCLIPNAFGRHVWTPRKAGRRSSPSIAGHRIFIVGIGFRKALDELCSLFEESNLQGLRGVTANKHLCTAGRVEKGMDM